MAIDIAYRKRAIAALTNAIGVYILCDLDQVPIYVGQSVDGIRSRVNRHLTSARSDIIANRQIDVWEIAWVWAFPTPERAEIGMLEAALFHHFNTSSPLMNGAAPQKYENASPIPQPNQIVQVMTDQEISEKRDPALRLPRQIAHYEQIVGHFLAVKNSSQISRSMHAHFSRLEKYHRKLLRMGEPEVGGEDSR